MNRTSHWYRIIAVSCLTLLFSSCGNVLSTNPGWFFGTWDCTREQYSGSSLENTEEFAITIEGDEDGQRGRWGNQVEGYEGLQGGSWTLGSDGVEIEHDESEYFPELKVPHEGEIPDVFDGSVEVVEDGSSPRTWKLDIVARYGTDVTIEIPDRDSDYSLKYQCSKR